MEAKYRNPVMFNDYVKLFGAFHIEQSLGEHADLINGSGLLEILNHLNFTTIAVPHPHVFWYRLNGMGSPKKWAQKSPCNTSSIYITCET